MLYYQKNSEFFAQVAGGLETMAAEELQELGARDVRTSTRGITFRAERSTTYHVVVKIADYAEGQNEASVSLAVLYR